MTIDFKNPFQQPGVWLKGNLHMHTTESDGKLSPIDAVKRYENGGFGFIAITDHNKRTMPDVTTNGMILIPGEEIDISRGGCYHIVAVNTDRAIGLSPDEKKTLSPADVIARIHAAGGEAILAHPYWSNETIEQTKLCAGIIGVEVYNHDCHVWHGSGHSMVHWDDMLRIGMRVNGFASDDAHAYSASATRPDDALGGFTMVKAKDRTPEAVMEAIRAGYFYASNGPEITNVTISGSTVSIETSPVRSVSFRTPHWNSVRYENTDGTLMTAVSHTIAHTMRIMRIECMDDTGRMAWTNPFWLSE